MSAGSKTEGTKVVKERDVIFLQTGPPPHFTRTFPRIPNAACQAK